MINQYRHKRTGIIVSWGEGSERYISEDAKYYIAKGIVEQSTEWEMVVPVFDFFGNELKHNELAYYVILEKDGNLTSINNNRTFINAERKILATLKTYEAAQRFQRIYVSLAREKALLITAGGNPSAYLKNLLKTL